MLRKGDSMSIIIKIENYKDDINIFSMENEHIKLKVTNLGCRILELYMPDKNGVYEDVLLGLDKLEDVVSDSAYFGAVLGRVANRIKGGRFSLSGKEYKLVENNNGNHLHGGIRGFDKQVFGYKEIENGIQFFYLSKDGEEGYPGNLRLWVEYSLHGDTLLIDYRARTDKDTIISPTNHMYFNLSGRADYVGDHSLYVEADKVCRVDEFCMGTGEIFQVEGTAYDFRKHRLLGDGLGNHYHELKAAKGYDNPFIFNKRLSTEEVREWASRNEADLNEKFKKCVTQNAIKSQLELGHEESGRRLQIATSAQAVQVYTGNYLSASAAGKEGKPYADHSGVALETETIPNLINSMNPEEMILRVGEEYLSTSAYRFFIK